MFGTQTNFRNQAERVIEAAKKGAYKTFRHAILSIRKDASKSIKQRKDKHKKSEAGSPPTQHKPGFLKRALWGHWDEEGGMTGFRASRVDEVAATHEHGLREDGRDYPERPTMGPALERNVERFHRDWRASIG